MTGWTILTSCSDLMTISGPVLLLPHLLQPHLHVMAMDQVPHLLHPQPPLEMTIIMTTTTRYRSPNNAVDGQGLAMAGSKSIFEWPHTISACKKHERSRVRAVRHQTDELSLKIKQYKESLQSCISE